MTWLPDAQLHSAAKATEAPNDVTPCCRTRAFITYFARQCHASRESLATWVNEANEANEANEIG
jgi:hypothetical protein